MKNAEILQKVLAYIDDHVRDELSAETLAVVAGFSTYHFCRIFLWGTGYPVMLYVRGRRLAFAAAALSSGQRIIDIAMEYGFGTHSGFSKAFRRHFGCTPEVYRMHAQCVVPVLPSLERVEKYAIGGIVMEPKWKTLPAIRLAGYALHTKTGEQENNKEIPAFWMDYMTDGRMSKLHSAAFVKAHDEYGACFMLNPEMGEMRYVIGVEASEGAEIPEEFHVCEIPAATYAVFSTPPTDKANFSQTIQGVWQYIYAEWFPNSGYEYAPNAVDYELYDARCMDAHGNVCEIHIPVVKK